MARRPLLQRWFDRIPPTFKNKYFLALALFAVWMLFLDKHDVITRIRLQRAVDKLERDHRFFMEKIEEERQLKLDLDEYSEKFARERYYMKRSNEDVFILVKE